MPRRAFGLKLPAAIREESPNVRERIATVSPESLLFLDEMGAKTNMTRLYGRARKGIRAVDSAPCGYWHTTTLIGVVGLEGAKAPMVVEGATDTDLFTAYVEHMLLPELKPGMIVVMDNLTPHKAPAVAAMIKAAGAEPLFSPPYSPDLKPIELMWAKIKELLRVAKARTKQELWDAVAKALSMVSQEDAKNWFRHYGVATIC